MDKNRKLNERTNNIHEISISHASRKVYKDLKSSFQVLLIDDGIHHRNLQKLETEMDLSPGFINDV